MDRFRPALRAGSSLLGRIEVVVASVLLAVMVVIVFTDVLLRYVWDAPLTGAGEIATTLFVWVVMLGSASAARRRLHVGVGWFVEQLPTDAQRVAHWAATGAIVAILLVTAWFGLELMNGSRDRTLPLTDLPLRVVYAGLPLGCLLMAVAYLSPEEPRDDAVPEEPVG